MISVVTVTVTVGDSFAEVGGAVTDAEDTEIDFEVAFIGDEVMLTEDEVVFTEDVSEALLLARFNAELNFMAELPE